MAVYFPLTSFPSNCDFSAGFLPKLRSPNCLGISRRSARGCNGTAGIPCGRQGTCCLLQMLPLKMNKCVRMIYIFILSAGGLCVACKEGQREFLAGLRQTKIPEEKQQSDRRCRNAAYILVFLMWVFTQQES